MTYKLEEFNEELKSDVDLFKKNKNFMTSRVQSVCLEHEIEVSRMLKKLQFDSMA